MKFSTVALVCLFLAGLPSVIPVAAQQNGAGNQESDYYYVTVPVEHLYTYRLGYVVAYRSGVAGIGHVYLPIEWFTQHSGEAQKGQIVSLTGPGSWPCLMVYYKNGEFSHVKLMVHHSRAHDSWRTLPNSAEMDANFEGVDSIRLEFR